MNVNRIYLDQIAFALWLRRQAANPPAGIEAPVRARRWQALRRLLGSKQTFPQPRS